MHQTVRVARDSFPIKIAKNWHVRGSPLSALRGRFGVMLLLGGFANGCDKTHWHGCARQSSSDAAGLVASGLAAGGC